MRLRLLILMSLMVTLAPAAHAAVSGTWTNVRVDDRNGETHGMIVEVREDSVIVTDCEKQCGQPVVADARIDGKRIAFSADLGRGAVSRFTGEVRDDGTLVLRVAGRVWNAQILQPAPAEAEAEAEARSLEDTDAAGPPPQPVAGQAVVVPSLAGMTFDAEPKPKGLIHVVTQAAPAARFAGFYSNIVYREGAEHTSGMAIDFRPGAASVVTVHDCDLYCEHTETVPVTLRGYRIRYRLEEAMRDYPANGRRFVGEFRADGTLKVWGEGYPQFARVLRPRARD